MKECYPDKEKWAHMVCALFIEEVSFNDTQTSSGIITSSIPPFKRVSSTRKVIFEVKKFLEFFRKFRKFFEFSEFFGNFWNFLEIF